MADQPTPDQPTPDQPAPDQHDADQHDADQHDARHVDGWVGEPTPWPARVVAPFAPFRPRRGRAVALGFQWGSLALFAALAVLLPTTAGGAVWSVVDRVMFFLIGVAIAWVAHRYASIVAVPSRQGLVVRNLVVTRTLEWTEIVGVHFAGGDPWVGLDLADADTLAVMAIQKADGPVAQREASRLAALVHALGGGSGPADDASAPHA